MVNRVYVNITDVNGVLLDRFEVISTAICNSLSDNDFMKFEGAVVDDYETIGTRIEDSMRRN